MKTNLFMLVEEDVLVVEIAEVVVGIMGGVGKLTRRRGGWDYGRGWEVKPFKDDDSETVEKDVVVVEIAEVVVGIVGGVAKNLAGALLKSTYVSPHLKIELQPILLHRLHILGLLHLEMTMNIPLKKNKRRRTGNQPAPQPVQADHLDEHVSHSKLRGAFTILANSVTAQNKCPAAVQANLVANIAVARIRDFTRMNPPSFTGSKSKEDPQEFLDMV
ncbi:hypothetical protein FXO38_31397 [Capsicum annuum]|nr:hypothetical protein FXO37_35046 [Capsicum annuum]KAF3622246.1 hypothetical protein FXO38_31397 [Capsicum annuum]